MVFAVLGLLAVAFAGCSGEGASGPLTAEKVLADVAEALVDPASSGLTSFSGTAQITGPADLEETDYAVELPKGTVEVSYRAPDRQRLLIRTESPSIASGEETLVVWNGDRLLYFNSQRMEYSEWPEESGAYLQWRFNPALYFGGNIGNLLGQLEESEGITANITGEETILGREVYVIEVSPLFTSSSSGDDEESSGVMRLWIDKQHLFMLRMDTPAGADKGDLSLEYTAIEFNGDVPDSDFEFEPPPGATQVERDDDSTSSNRTSMGDGKFPSGFLDPLYRPGGYDTVGQGSSQSSSGQRLEAHSEFKLGDDYLVIRERVRKDGMPEALKQGESVDVNGLDAWFDEAGPVRSLSWQQGDFVIQITADALPAEELLRIAWSMEAVP
jgi:outer membrane lipoprotein-sorting protein